MKEMPLNKLFTFNIKGKTIAYGASIAETIQKMATSKQNCLLVKKDSDIPVGIISEHDIVIAFARKGKAAEAQKVYEYMTIDMVAAKETYTIDEALKLMAAHNVRHLPVLSEKGQIIDFLSMMDLIVKRTMGKS